MTVILITGANTGIGFETVKALMRSDREYNIILCGRQIARADEAAKQAAADVPNSKSTVTTVSVDVCSDASIQAAFETVSAKFDRVDVLVNNAGASFDNMIASGQMTTREGFAASWDVNVTGAHIMTHTFAPLLLKSADPRLLFITSGTSSLAESHNLEQPINKSPSKGWPKTDLRPLQSYRSTKTGLNMLMREWDKIFRHDGVKVFALAPGFLATGLGGEDLRKWGAGEPHIGGESVRKVVEGGRDDDVGKVIRNYSTLVQPY